VNCRYAAHRALCAEIQGRGGLSASRATVETIIFRRFELDTAEVSMQPRATRFDRTLLRGARVAALALLLGSCASAPVNAPIRHEAVSDEHAIQEIAGDIERLKAQFPQLRDFSAHAHCDPQRLVISYSFKTHAPPRQGGWTSGVPHPDDDGVWFYIDFHDPDSTAQIHTQPVVPPLYYRGKNVMFLSLEGAQTQPLASALQKILFARGITDRPD
jgi:hypothetical protein